MPVFIQRIASLSLAGLIAWSVCPALADAPKPPDAPAPAAQDDRAARRFPQPVRVGNLPGRMLLQPREDQPVLGYVEGVVRQGDGSASLVVRLSGWLGLGWFGTRLVAVPTAVVALLGEHVAAMDIKPEELDALPTFVEGSAPAIEPNDTLLIGLVKPFH